MTRGSALALLLAACGTTPPPGAPAHVDVTTPADLGTTERPGRPWRRMDIDQLAASIEAVTGVAWTDEVDGETVSLFDELSGSLGKPDYKSSTDEDLAPGLLFQKFLGDAAAMTCTELVERERLPTGGDHRLLVEATLVDTPVTAPDRVDANLRAALLRFHGRRVTAGSDDLARWRWLFDATWEDSGDTARAWRTVCVALLTHPDFYAY